MDNWLEDLLWGLKWMNTPEGIQAETHRIAQKYPGGIIGAPIRRMISGEDSLPSDFYPNYPPQGQSQSTDNWLDQSSKKDISEFVSAIKDAVKESTSPAVRPPKVLVDAIKKFSQEPSSGMAITGETVAPPPTDAELFRKDPLAAVTSPGGADNSELRALAEA